MVVWDFFHQQYCQCRVNQDHGSTHPRKNMVENNFFPKWNHSHLERGVTFLFSKKPASLGSHKTIFSIFSMCLIFFQHQHLQKKIRTKDVDDGIAKVWCGDCLVDTWGELGKVSIYRSEKATGSWSLRFWMSRN